MIHRIAKKYGTTYYAAFFCERLFDRLPWGGGEFDCLIFSPSRKNSLKMERLLNDLPYAHIDWVFTTGIASKYWHDCVDQKSVEKGIQKEIGDGHPMTAAFDEIRTPSDWNISFNFGRHDQFLFIFLNRSETMVNRVKTLAGKIRER